MPTRSISILFLFSAFLSVVGIFTLNAPLTIGGRLRFTVPTVSSSIELSKEGQELLERGNAESNLTAKIDLYCKALSQMGQAMAEEPFNSRVLLNWANIRQILGTISCPEPFTQGQSGSVLSVALGMSSTNPSIRYSAGLIALWSGDFPRARKLFKETMEYGLALTPGQRIIMATTLTAPEDIPELIPARFPHIVQWYDAVQRSPSLHDSEGESEETQKELGKLQVEALLENRRELDERRITPEIFQTRLLALLPTALQSDARRIVDKELAQAVFPQVDSSEHRFFDRRSGLNEVSIVRSYRSMDSRPERTPFTSWDPPETVNLLNSYTSIGFFAKDKVPLRLISLRSESMGYAPSVQNLKVFVSDDNQQWREVTDAVKIEPLQVLNYIWYSLVPKESISARYWKIHFSVQERTRQFSGKLFSMIRAFGEGE